MNKTTSVSRILVFVDPLSCIHRLDSIGIAGFGHDFKALEGHESPVIKVFNTINDSNRSNRRLLVVIGAIFPFVAHLPTKRLRMMDQMKQATSEMAHELLQNTVKAKEGSQSIKDRSILGLLSAFQLFMHPFVTHVAYQSKGKLKMRISSWYRRKLFHR
jgi:hypothetical protein